MKTNPYQFDTDHHLDSFKIVSPIFAGALAEVYRAIDIHTRQSVVIKVPSLDIINHPLVYYHYQNEVRVLSQINHPRVVNMIQKERSSAYSVFEYIPGTDLRHQMRDQGRFPISKGFQVIAQAAQGLAYLHGCGIIHMDIKPENLMITPMGTVKLVDFGLSRVLGTPDVLQEDFTRPHGTPYYAAPEQLALYRDDLRTDQYSLAVVFYELITGHLPFEKSSDLAKVKKRLKVDPVPPRHYLETLTGGVESVILKALSREPQNRYPSVQDFITALDREITSPTASIIRDPKAVWHHEDPAACPIRSDQHFDITDRHGLLVALEDNQEAEAIVAYALREAITKGTRTTLLTVVTGDKGDDWIRYGDQVKGEQWGQRLDKFAQQFRHYGFDPVVRIRTGEPAEVIVSTAKDIQAGMIIMGAPPKTIFRRLFGGGTLHRVLKRAPCRVKVAESAANPRFPLEIEVTGLDSEALKQLDYFLMALWTQQLNWLAALVQGVLAEPLMAKGFSPQESPVAAWEQKIKAYDHWAFLSTYIRSPLHRVEQAVAKMIDAAKKRNGSLLGRLYLKEALPLLCQLHTGIQDASAAIRRQVGEDQVEGQPSQVEGAACPIDRQRHSIGGPIRQIQAIRDHFCSQADNSTEACMPKRQQDTAKDDLKEVEK